ncbi:MAG TPA: hypothetical protein VNF99_16310 [Stellaceae bacterium]|nr:hypothetical protein [Stellaceae bacterium]
MEPYKTYRVSAAARSETLGWLLRGLMQAGCNIISEPARDIAPFKVIFDTPDGERMGAIFYLFTIGCRETPNRPADECRFQIKYGTKDGGDHEIWQDPTGLHTTVFLGIEPETGCFVAADPVLHNPTRMFISLEFKQHHLAAIRDQGWCTWERESRKQVSEPVEILVGGRPERLLDLVRFERSAKGLDQGHRQLLAEQQTFLSLKAADASDVTPAPVSQKELHELAREFQLTPDHILDLISTTPRLKMAVRGWVAEDHLLRVLQQTPGVADCHRIAGEATTDISLRYRGSRPILIECKNVLRKKKRARVCMCRFSKNARIKGRPLLTILQARRIRHFGSMPACRH